MPKVKEVAKVSLSDKSVQLKRISENVWQITDTLYDDIELLMNSGFFNGQSAAEISEYLIQYLKNPQFLTEKEIQELFNDGQISGYQASKLKEEMYKPLPKGVYRSPFKNAFRLARTETNNAYHNQDYINRQKLPFVIGIRVNLSEQHPKFDMCDDLQGKYPPDFIFTSWHPQCLCHTTSILAPESELRKFYRDENPNFNYIKERPKRANEWIKSNSARINKMKSKPFWIKDNEIKT